MSAVLVALLAEPESVSLAESGLEEAGELGPAGPVVLAVAVGQAMVVIAAVGVTVREGLDPVALLDELAEVSCFSEEVPW